VSHDAAVSADRACTAPHTSLKFDQYGWVTVCSANSRDVLGHVAERSIADMWRGEELQRIRAAFVDGGLAPGCDLCRWQRSQGGDEIMYARLYDWLAPRATTHAPVHAEFVFSNRCNLRCVMCNGALSSSIRSEVGLPPLASPYPDRFFDELAGLLPGFAQLKFLGGEPFLSAEAHRVWEAVAALDAAPPSCHVTTNGTVWTPRMEALLERVPMSFAVSLDGATAATVESIRRGADFGTVMANLDRFQEHAARHGTDVTLTYCLMVDNWHELGDFLLLAEARGVETFVNTVITPFRLSVYKLPRPQLRAVIEELEARSPVLEPRLVRNLGVWRDQLVRLRAALDAPDEQTESPVHFPAFDPPRLDPPAADTADARASVLRAWSDVQPLQLDVGPEGSIRSIDPGHLADLGVEHLVGGGIDELFVWLHAAFGRPADSSYEEHRVDRGDRLLRFESSDQETEVRILSERVGDHADWLLATRSAPH